MGVGKVELHLAGGRASTALFAGADERARKVAKLSSKIKEIDQTIATLAKDPAADPAFVKTQVARKAELEAERKKLAKARATPPAGAYATATLERIRRALPRDPGLVTAM